MNNHRAEFPVKRGYSGNRRAFLKSAGLLAVATPMAVSARSTPPPAASEWWHGQNAFRILAEGVIPNIPVDPPIPWVLPPMDTDPIAEGIQPPAIPDGFEPRLRAAFPVGRTRNLLAVQIYVVPIGSPLPLPAAPAPEPPGTISYYTAEVTHVQVGESPVPGSAARLPSLLVTGKVLSNPVLSPFGDLTGSPCMLSTSFYITDPVAAKAEFVLLSAACAGNHVSFAPSGGGMLVLKR